MNSCPKNIQHMILANPFLRQIAKRTMTAMVYRFLSKISTLY